MSNKYKTLQAELETKGEGEMKCFGSSMTPILQSGSLLRFKQCENYEIGDIVFCKVKGRFIDAHKITKKDAQGRFMIANNHGWENGWANARAIFGKVIAVNGQPLE